MWYDYLNGMRVDEARKSLEENGSLAYICVTREDTTNYMITANLDFRRLKVSVDNGIITEIHGLG